MIRIDKLTKYYPRQQVPALDAVTLQIPAGSVFGLLGPNGAGKTTLISILVGLQKYQSGQVHFLDMPLAQNLAAVRAVTGFVPQDLAFYPMLSVAENLAFYVDAFGVPRAEREQRIAQAVAAARLEEHYRKRADNLSGGLKRRLNLAIGLLNNPRVLFLDEPTVGIDPQSRHFILDTISRLNRERGMTIIYTSHYMEEVQQICDQIAIIDSGRILLSGPLEELLERERGTTLRLRLQRPAEAPLLQRLNERFDARSDDGREFILQLGGPLQGLDQLLPLLADHDARIDGLQYGFESLEQLYLSHTTSAPRE
ncbi:MAG: ABC transporter ATP-binding protein [Pseudomonadota bacterium]